VPPFLAATVMTRVISTGPLVVFTTTDFWLSKMFKAVPTGMMAAWPKAAPAKPIPKSQAEMLFMVIVQKVENQGILTL
jgi:hypothetical protein